MSSSGTKATSMKRARVSPASLRCVTSHTPWKAVSRTLLGPPALIVASTSPVPRAASSSSSSCGPIGRAPKSMTVVSPEASSRSRAWRISFSSGSALPRQGSSSELIDGIAGLLRRPARGIGEVLA
ncbi:MAG: hypothetical protein M5R42_06155 [Rhodocyclaceae bacterium]|nr:hypothetical protein [Rhodocyclaceae bacterium]